jgi:hypothetical protein
MVRRFAFVAALVVAGTSSVKAQDLPVRSQEFAPDPITAVYRLSYPVVNAEGDTMNYVAIADDNQRTYWNNVPQGMELSPGLVNPPRTTFSRSRMTTQNGWKHSIDVSTGLVAASVPLGQGQAVTTAKMPLAPVDSSPAASAPTPDPVVAVYRLSYPIVNREGDTMNYVAIAADNQRTYWNNVPQGQELRPGLVAPPNTTFSRTRMIVNNGWKHSIDVNSGMVAGSVPVSQTTTTAKIPLPQQAPIPADPQTVR